MIMRLKALLVDDEINILRNLQQILPWEANDVDIVGFAKNGVQALELVKQHNPHLIFCDIRMPVMDGIEFLQELRSFNDEVEVITLTGYQDFEYARSVLRYRVLDYILKPIDYDALEQFFLKTVNQIKQKLLQTQLADQEQGRMKDIAFEKVLLDLLLGYQHQAQAQKWNDAFEPGEIDYALFVVECSPQLTQPAASNALLQQLADTFAAEADSAAAYLLHVEERFWAIVVAGQLQRLQEQQLQSITANLQQELSKGKDSGMTIAVYETVAAADELHHIWKMMCREITFAHQIGIIVQAPKPDRHGNVQHVWSCVDRLIAAIKHTEQSSANRCLAELSEQLRTLSSQSLQQVEKLVNSLIVYMIKELRRYDAVSAEVEQYIWQQLSITSKLKSLLELICKMVEEAFVEHANKRPQVSIHVAKEYIESHLSSDIAAEEVANYLNISLSYFSTLFKQYYGVTFIEFVTQARIERAKSLLTMTKKSITEIAKTVGYTERRYFNKVFQKRVGMLPSEYRENQLLRNEVS